MGFLSEGGIINQSQFSYSVVPPLCDDCLSKKQWEQINNLFGEQQSGMICGQAVTITLTFKESLWTRLKLILKKALRL